MDVDVTVRLIYVRTSKNTQLILLEGYLVRPGACVQYSRWFFVSLWRLFSFISKRIWTHKMRSGENNTTHVLKTSSEKDQVKEVLQQKIQQENTFEKSSISTFQIVLTLERTLSIILFVFSIIKFAPSRLVKVIEVQEVSYF